MVRKLWRCLSARAASLRPQPRAASSQSGIANADDIDLRCEATAWMAKEGFKYVLDPMNGRYIEGFDCNAEYQFMCAQWDKPSVFRLSDASPYFNIAGLRFREITQVTSATPQP